MADARDAPRWYCGVCQVVADGASVPRGWYRLTTARGDGSYLNLALCCSRACLAAWAIGAA